MRLLLTLLSLFPFCLFGQTNDKLKHELDSMYVLDQRNREWLAKLGNNQPLTDSLSEIYKTDRAKLGGALWTEQVKIDSSNLSRAEAIIKQYGYPGKTMVSTPANEIVFYIIQHSSKIPVYLPLIKKAAEEGELPFSQYAMMLDRALMHKGNPQVYGTQVSCRQLLKTKQSRCFVWPITDAKRVNERRKQAGFALSIEENANRLNAAYEPDLTMETVRKLYVLK